MKDNDTPINDAMVEAAEDGELIADLQEATGDE